MEHFEIGGRTFQLAGEGTARHDVYTMRQIAACGLNMVAQRDGETDDEFTYRMYLTALQTGDIFLLLGALLVPFATSPVAWSEAIAKETAEFMANITDPGDKAKVRILLACALTPFFVGGRRSSKTSRNSSPHPGSDLAHIVSAASLSTEIGG